MEETAPEFEPVFTNVYQYYGNSLISFTNTIDDLLLQLPILIKLKVQVPMSLFSIKMAPVPLDAETYLGEKREYTQIIPETELIALTENNYIPLISGRSRISHWGGANPLGGANLQCIHFLVKMYVKTK